MAPKKKTPDWTGGCAFEMEGLSKAGADSGDLADLNLLSFYNLSPKFSASDSKKLIDQLHGVNKIPRSLVCEVEAPRIVGLAPPRDHSVCPYAGLKNIGNTCYLNCLLQYIYMNITFRRAIIEATRTPGDDVLHSWQHLFCMMQESSQRVCNPTALVDAAKLSSGEQEDVMEQWGCLLKYMDKFTYGDITRLISFKVSWNTRCMTCNKESERTEVFSELMVRLQPEMDATPTQKVVLSLEEKLTESFTTELLEGVDQYECPECGVKRDGKRVNHLRSVPEFLHIVVSRSYWDVQRNERVKVCHEIEYPKILDLEPLFSLKEKFELTAVLEHHSQVSDSGHYTAFLKQAPGPVASSSELPWWMFNDSQVSQVQGPGSPSNTQGSLQRWSSAAAYMLAYRRIVQKDGVEAIYREPEINIPSDLLEAVNVQEAKAQAKAREAEEMKGQRVKTVLRRIDQIHNLESLLASCEGAAPHECSFVPRAWFLSWWKCEEVDEDDNSVRLDFSNLLLRLPDSTIFKLDPFAVWQDEAVIMPTTVLESLLELGSGRTVALAPKGMTLKDTIAENFLCRDAAVAIRSLLQNSRNILQLLGKIRDGTCHHEPWKANMLVRQTVVTKLNDYYGRLHIIAKRRRLQPFNPSSWDLLTVLMQQRKRHLKLSSAMEAENAPLSSKSWSTRRDKESSSEYDLSSDIVCRHGQQNSRYPTIQADVEDVNRLCRLAEKMRASWRMIGYCDVVTVACPKRLSLEPNVCQICKGEKNEEVRQAKKRRTIQHTNDIIGQVTRSANGSVGQVPQLGIISVSGPSAAAPCGVAAPHKNQGEETVQVESGSTPLCKKRGEEDVQWSCSVCTYLNHGLLQTCELCDNKRVP